MKNFLKGIACTLALAVLICSLAACDSHVNETAEDMYSGMVSEGRLYFHSASKTEALLADSKGSLTWLYSADKSIFEGFDTGDYVKVGHGMIMESYPGQTYISKIALINDGDIDSFTDEEWSRLSGVFVDGLER